MQDSEAKAKVKVSMWARITSYLPVRNQKNNISGLLSNMKSYFSDKTAKDWAFEFFFLAIELGLAAVLGVLMHAIAAMAGVGLFVSSGLTAVACALGLYCGRSMTQPMKVHIADKKQKAKRAIELQKQYNAVRMLDECSRIIKVLQTEMDIWMMDKSNVDNQKNVANVYKEVKALMIKQEKTFSALPEKDKESLEGLVESFFEGQTRFYNKKLLKLWEDGLPVSSIVHSLNEKGMPQDWFHLNILGMLEQDLKSGKDWGCAVDAFQSFEASLSTPIFLDPQNCENHEEYKDKVIGTIYGTLRSKFLSCSAEEKKKIHSILEAQKKKILGEHTQPSHQMSDFQRLFNGFLNMVVEEIQKDSKRKGKVGEDPTSTHDESKDHKETELPVMQTIRTDVANSHTADRKSETSTAQNGTGVVHRKDDENSLPKAEQEADKVEEESTSTLGLGFFGPQKGTDSHNDNVLGSHYDEGKLGAADQSNAADSVTNGGFQPTNP